MHDSYKKWLLQEVVLLLMLYSYKGIFVADSLKNDQAEDLANWMSVILGKEKVSKVMVRLSEFSEDNFLQRSCTSVHSITHIS